MNKKGEYSGGNSGIFSKVAFVLFILVIYRFGTYVPLPGVNLLILDEIIGSNSRGILSMMNVLTGGALGRMSVFSLNIMPYITSSIVMQLVCVLYKELGELRKSGEEGRQKITQYSKYLAVVLALFQGYGMAIGMEALSYNGSSLVADPGISFRVVAVFSLMCGTVIVIWFADQITSRGIGNGSSLIIFTGIISGLIPSFISFFEMAKNNIISTEFFLICFVLILLMITLIVFMERAYRKLLVQYPRRQVGKRLYGGDSTHLPIKINVSGVIPPIFATALLLFPSSIMSLGGDSYWHRFVMNYLTQGKLFYVIFYIILIIFFCFFYSVMVFNPEETAENLRKNGAVLVAKRPGKQTKDYLIFVLNRVTVMGALYLAVVCAVPEILVAKFSIPFYLSGTSLLIVISVVLDMSSQIQSHMLSNKYANLMKNSNIIRGFNQ